MTEKGKRVYLLSVLKGKEGGTLRWPTNEEKEGGGGAEDLGSLLTLPLREGRREGGEEDL